MRQPFLLRSIAAHDQPLRLHADDIQHARRFSLRAAEKGKLTVFQNAPRPTLLRRGIARSRAALDERIRLKLERTFTPPVALDFTSSCVPNKAVSAFVRVMPVVGLPSESFFASAKRIRESMMSPFHGVGVAVLSGVFAL